MSFVFACIILNKVQFLMVENAIQSSCIEYMVNRVDHQQNTFRSFLGGRAFSILNHFNVTFIYNEPTTTP